MSLYLARSEEFSNKITKVTFLYKKKNTGHLSLNKSNTEFNGTKLPVIRQIVLTMIKPMQVLKFSK